MKKFLIHLVGQAFGLALAIMTIKLSADVSLLPGQPPIALMSGPLFAIALLLMMTGPAVMTAITGDTRKSATGWLGRGATALSYSHALRRLLRPA